VSRFSSRAGFTTMCRGSMVRGSHNSSAQTSDTFQADDFRISLESAITHHLVWKLFRFGDNEVV
jgi:hypothetical protein